MVHVETEPRLSLRKLVSFQLQVNDGNIPFLMGICVLVSILYGDMKHRLGIVGLA